MTNEQVLLPIFKELYDKIVNFDYIIDKSGVKLVELIASKFELSPTSPILDFKIKKTNEKYCKKELEWYVSKDLNIKGWVDDIAIWKQVANKDGFVNSNYGWCCFDESDNYSQYDNCLQTLKRQKESRQAIMIYNRPSMHYDWNYNGGSDFICCMSNQFLIRNNQLISIVHFRSEDIIYGMFNDFYFKCYIYNKLFNDLLSIYPELEIGNIVWIANSLHCYERHFKLLKEIVETNE